MKVTSFMVPFLLRVKQEESFKKQNNDNMKTFKASFIIYDFTFKVL